MSPVPNDAPVAPLSRRTVLRSAAAGVAGLGAASLLAACGRAWYTQQQD